MNRKELHPELVAIINRYLQQPTTLANKILDLFDDCKHKDNTRTSDEFVYCHDCDKYIYYPKQK